MTELYEHKTIIALGYDTLSLNKWKIEADEKVLIFDFL